MKTSLDHLPDDKQHQVRLATKIERKDSLHRTLFKRIRTPVTLIAQDIHYVNRCLSQGQFFFSDILKEGVVLHDSGKLTLAEPKELQPIERRKAAEGDFEYWFNGANREYRLTPENLDWLAERVKYLRTLTETLCQEKIASFTSSEPS